MESVSGKSHQNKNGGRSPRFLIPSDDPLLKVREDVEGMALRLPEVELPALEYQHLDLADGGMDVGEPFSWVLTPDVDGDSVVL